MVGSALNRWFLVVFVVLLCLTVAAFPFVAAFFEPSASKVGSPSLDLPFYVKTETLPKSPKLDYVPNVVLIKFRAGVGQGEISELRIGQGAEEVYKSVFSGVRTWRVPPPKSVEEWVNLLAKNPLVDFAEPNYYVYSSMIPNDPGYGLQWHLDNPVYGGIHSEAAWDMVTGNSRVVVAVVDTGVAYENNVAPSYWHIDTYRA